MPQIDSRRRLAKFVDRSTRALAGPIFELQDLSDPNGGVELKLRLIVEDSRQRIEFDDPGISDDAILAAITRCRPFLLKSEDVFLPAVVEALLDSIPRDVRTHVAPLKEFVAVRVEGGRLGAPHWHVFTTDLPEGVDDSKIARAYVYGYAVKDDEDKRALIDKLGVESRSVKLAITGQLIQLMRLIRTVRTQLEVFVENGTIQLQTPVSDIGR